MRTEDRNARIVKLVLEIRHKQAEKRQLLAEAGQQHRPRKPARKHD